jgi:hypothetical protein
VDDNAIPGAAARRASFVLRLSRDATRAWHGVIELVGADRRAVIANEREIGEFIERSLNAIEEDRTEDRDV